MDEYAFEKLLPCPYNSTHQVFPHRLAKHIVKCKKNYPNADMKVCLFNAVHVVPTRQYEEHLLHCDSRRLVEQELYSKPYIESSAPMVKTVPIPAQNITGMDEDWESEYVGSSYSPENQSKYARRPPSGMSKSARKAWRESEIQRVCDLRRLEIGDSQSDSNTSMPEIAPASASGWAIPKSLDKFKFDVSESESTIVNGKMDKKNSSSDMAAAFTATLKESNNNDKSQGPKDMTKMVSFIKEKRKLEKKLVEIKKLEIVKTNNEKLTDQEEAKILLKKSIEEKLANLIADMNM